MQFVNAHMYLFDLKGLGFKKYISITIFLGEFIETLSVCPSKQILVNICMSLYHKRRQNNVVILVN